MNRSDFSFVLKATFFIALLCFSAPSNARYKFYRCLKQENVYACSAGCGKNQNATDSYLDFKVNVANNAVVTHIYTNNKYSHAWNYSECKVVDKKNWSCVWIPSSGTYTGDLIHEMSSGIFYQYEQKFENITDKSKLPLCSKDTLF